MKNLTLTFLYMERVHLGKDVACVPRYLGEKLGCEVHVVSLTSSSNRDMPEQIDGVHYHRLFQRGDRSSGPYKYLFFWWYLIRNARKIDVFMRFHLSVPTMIEVMIYRLFNPRGRIYIKADMGYEAEERLMRLPRWKRFVKQTFCRWGLSRADVLSCESRRVYDRIIRPDSPFYAKEERTVLVPNGFDEELLKKMGLRERTFQEKENLIITVGRLSDYEKNTDMILRALERTDMKDWKYCLIGPVDETLQSKVDRFFEEHPEKKGSVIFTGPIYDKEKLWEYYNQAKVFVLASRTEGYAIVFGEAKRFRNYIISTDVGGAEDTICAGRFGEYVDQDDAAGLSQKLQEIIDGRKDTNVFEGEGISQELNWAHVLEPVAQKLKE